MIDQDVEQVAKAIFAADETLHGGPWDNVRQMYKDHYRTLARAAISAMAKYEGRVIGLKN